LVDDDPGRATDEVAQLKEPSCIGNGLLGGHFVCMLVAIAFRF
jgi:hypothetical protein